VPPLLRSPGPSKHGIPGHLKGSGGLPETEGSLIMTEGRVGEDLEGGVPIQAFYPRDSLRNFRYPFVHFSA